MRQPGSAFGAPAAQHVTAGFIGHAGSKTVQA